MIYHAFALALLQCLCSTSASTVYTATLTELDGSGVSASVTIFVDNATGQVRGVGSATGLEADLTSTLVGGANCTALNGCGAHVHSGSACTNTTTQGGHYYNGTTDPWASIGYMSTTSAGVASFTFIFTDPATDMSGKPFIVHNNSGGRVSCGILSAVSSPTLYAATLTNLTGAGVSGSVLIFIKDANTVQGVGNASSLEANLKSYLIGGANCTAKNGCGVHVHSGTACDNSTVQGGHYYLGTSDPWTNISYHSTDAAGLGNFVFSITDSAVDVVDKPFIVHYNDGSRVGCGLLAAYSSQSPAPSPSPSGAPRVGAAGLFPILLVALLSALVA